MAARRGKKKNKYTVPIIIAVIIIIILIIVLVVLNRSTNSSTPQVTNTVISNQNQEQKDTTDKATIEKLSNMKEQERMQYYCSNFFQMIDNKSYEKAYSKLYSDYKENYFPTLTNFEKYFKDYFPAKFALSYTNIERLGDIYVLNVVVTDTVNGSLGHNFSMYVVIQENSLNDYVISFSRNSAVNNNGEE